MLATETIPRPVRRAVADWAGRLAARLLDLKDQVKDHVIDAVGRTAAEAAEVALRRVFGAGRPRPAFGAAGGWPDDLDSDAAGPADAWASYDAVARPSARGRPWRAVALAGLHALAWWLRGCALGPTAVATAALVGAALLLLD